MKQLLCGWVALGLLVGGTGEAKGQPSYVYTTLDVPGSSLTSANGINNAGQIVGAYQVPGDGYHGFLLSSGSYTTLDSPFTMPGPNTIASGVNDVTQVVGYNFRDRFLVGFLLSGGTYTMLFVPGARDTMPGGINNPGQIVGTYTDSDRIGHGFQLDGGTYTFFGPTNTDAYGINDAGQIVGEYGAGGRGYGYLLSGSTFTRIDPPQSTYSLAVGINNGGQIVGEYNTGNRGYGYLYSGDTYTTLDVPGSGFTNANGINNTGQIVGFYSDATGDHGYLLSEGEYTTLDVPGSFDTFAEGINDAGQIVGYYVDPAGVWHGFLATPVRDPPPSHCLQSARWA
jgi:uncharacterized membrane protein